MKDDGIRTGFKNKVGGNDLKILSLIGAADEVCG